MADIYLDEFLKGSTPARNDDNSPPGTIWLDQMIPATASKPQVSPGIAPFKRGILQTGADVYNAVGMGLQGVGATDVAQSFYQKAQKWQAERDAIPRQVPDIDSIHSAGDLVTYAYESLAESAPQLATLAIGGGGVGIAARVLGAAPRIARGAAEVAAFLGDAGLRVGQSGEIAQQAGKDPDDLRVVGEGIGKAALDFLPFMAIAKQVGLAPVLERSIIGQLSKGGYLKRAAGNAGVLVATAVPTAVAQQYMDIALDNTLKNYNGPITPEQVSQLKNAAAGAATFGLLGLGTAIGRPDVTEGQGAPQGAPPQGQLSGPQPLLALPAPPDFVVGADGTIVPRRGAKLPTQGLLPAPQASGQFTVDSAGGVRSLSEASAHAIDQARFDREASGVLRADIGAKHPSYADFYDPKTGELTAPAEDYQRYLVESQRTVQYDPFSDQVVQQPNTFSARRITPGWISPDGESWVLNATPDGTAEALIQPTPKGFEVRTPYGVSLGTYESLEGAQTEGSRYAKDGSTTISFTPSSPADLRVPSDHARLAASILQIPENQRTPLENAIVAVDRQRQSAQDAIGIDVHTDQALRTQQIDPGIRTLMQLRDELLSDSSLRRSRDGMLTNAGQAKLDNLDARISKLADKLGIPSPVGEEPPRIQASAGKTGNVAGRIAQIQNTEAELRSVGKYKNLTKDEGSLLDSLEQKELIEGLNEKEYASLERLTAKRDGEVKPETRPQSAGELNELLQLMRRRRQGLLSNVVDLGQARKIRNSAAGRIEKLLKTPDKLAESATQKYDKELSSTAFPWEYAGRLEARVDSAVDEPGFRASLERENITEPIGTFGTREEAQRAAETARQRALDDHVAQIEQRGGMSQYVDQMEGIAGFLARRGKLEHAQKVLERAHDRANFERARRARRERAQSDVPVLNPTWTNEPTERGLLYLPHEKAPLDWAVGSVHITDEGYFEARAKLGGEWTKLGDYADVADAAKAVEQAAKFRRKPIAPTGISAGAVRDAILPMWGQIPAALRPRVVIAKSTDGRYFPKDSQLAERAKGAAGIYTPGKVFLLHDNMSSIRDAQLTFLHEVFVHHGFSVFLKPEDLKAFLKAVYNTHAKEIGDTGHPITNLIEAEEYVARIAEKAYTGSPLEPYQTSFLDRVIAMVRRAIRVVWPKLEVTQREILTMLSDTAKFLTGQFPGRNRGNLFSPEAWRGELYRIIGRSTSEKMIEGLDSFADVWGAKLSGVFLTPLQMAERFKFEGARRYIEQVQRWWARKRDLTSDATDIAEEWQGLPKREMNRLTEAIFKITKDSETAGRRLNADELKRVFEGAEVGPAAQALWQRMDKSFGDILTKLQSGLEFSALRSITGDREQALAFHKLWQTDKEGFKTQVAKSLKDFSVISRLLDINGQIDALRNTHYFPYSRFGQYALTVRAKRNITSEGRELKGPAEGKRGGVASFETFESYAARDKRIGEIVHEYDPKDYSFHATYLSDQEFVFLNMPPALMDELKGKLNLSQEQQDLLRELYLVKSPGNKFLRHLAKRNGVAGFSQDALRVYASYMMNAANHLARVEFHQDMESSINELRNSSQQAGDVAGIVRDYFAKHFDYIMNPKSDWSGLRSLGFMWYLGFNVKSALVNLSQVPMVAFPYLSSIHGVLKSNASLMRAYGTVLNWRLGRTVLDPALDADIKRGIAEGFIDESRATELAALGESDTLQRMLPLTKNGKLMANMSYYGSYLFRHAEKFNREVTFIAARDLALQAGMSAEDAFLAGKKAVQTTMFEYAKWNRPEFMRGKKSVFFLFWNYMQHLSYLAFGGSGFKTASRVWLMLAVAGGAQGLPFAEDLLDLVDWGSTQVKEALGSVDPRTDLRSDIRQLAQTITDQPDLVMHGLSRYYGLGGLHALQLLGVPVPDTDISSSISAGRVIPGMEQATSNEPDPDKRLGETLVNALGPALGMGYSFVRTLLDTNPDEWKRWERAMPNAMKVASQALRRGTRGEETSRGGGAVVKFDPQDTESRAEVIANALGFQPTRLNQVQEMRTSLNDLKEYWTTRRALVIENYAYASMSGDQDSLADARRKIDAYNETVPDGNLRVTSSQILRSLKQRTRLAELREQGLPSEKAFVPLYRALSEAYPEGAAQLPVPDLAQ